MKRRQKGILSLFALWNSTHSMHFPCLGQSTFGQNEAGHWWTGMKTNDVNRVLNRSNQKTWTDRAPEYINMMYGTRMLIELWEASRFDENDNVDYHIKYFYTPWYLTGKTYTFENVPDGTVVTIPKYQYLSGEYGATTAELVTVETREFTVDGPFTLTYEEIASMERARRAPMYCVVMNNVILGGPSSANSPTAVITDSATGNKGYFPTSMKKNNFIAYEYDDIMPGAAEFDYTLADGVWELIMRADETVEEAALEELAYTATVPTKAGLIYEFDYDAWFDEVYPDFYN